MSYSSILLVHNSFTFLLYKYAFFYARPNLVTVSITSRVFPQKALTGWMERGMKERARLVTDYLRAAGGFSDKTSVGGWNGKT